MVELRVERRVTVVGASPEVVDRLRRAFTHPNPAARSRPGEPATIETSKLGSDGVLTLPRGGMARAREVLRAAGVEAKAVDGRQAGRPLGVPYLRELWPHQERIVAAVLRKQNLLVEAATGAGKTSAAIAAACRAGRWAVSVVRNQALLDQWVARIASDCGVPARDVGVVQGSKRTLRPFTVAMQQTLSSRPFTEDELAHFGFVVVDEVQSAPARTCYEVIDRFPAKYRVGVSADHTRRDRLDFLGRDLFGDVEEAVGREETEARGLTVPVQVAVVPTGYRPGGWYWDALSSSNAFRVRWAQRKLTDELSVDAGRVALAADIAAREVGAGRTVAIFADRREGCARIADAVGARGVPVGLMLGGAEDKREFDATARRVKSGDLRCAVGTLQAIGTGVDVPALDSGVVTCHLSNNKQLLNQVRGRFSRAPAGKESGRLWYLLDESVRGKKAVRNIAEWCGDAVVLRGDRWVEAAEDLR